MNIVERAKQMLSLDLYNHRNEPAFAGLVQINVPEEEQFILRMLIQRPLLGGQFIPKEYRWVNPILEKAYEYQRKVVGIIHPYVYLTIRHGIVATEKDDEWHVDGFSMKINHLPEQNYIWSNTISTEYLIKPIQFHPRFDPFEHNVHYYIQDSLSVLDKPHKMIQNNVYCIDPYVIHRRPKEATGKQRTFVRVSFCPIEIMDDNNTQNPLFPVAVPKYNLDGVKDFRDKLKRFEP